MRSFFKTLLAICIFFTTAASAETPVAAQRLLARLKNIKTLEANFSQENFDAKNKSLQKQNGSFKVTENGKFIWSIAAPYEQKIISDGVTLKIFDPDLEQLTIKPLDKKAQVIPLLLFSGEGEAIAQQYEISSPEANHFDLRARDKNSLFETLTVSFQNDRPVSLVITDSMKQKTVVSFDKVVVNQTLKASLFEFEAPAGSDVIDER